MFVSYPYAQTIARTVLNTFELSQIDLSEIHSDNQLTFVVDPVAGGVFFFDPAATHEDADTIAPQDGPGGWRRLIKNVDEDRLKGLVADSFSTTLPSPGAVAVPLRQKLQERVSVLDFGADPSGTRSSQAAFDAAIATGRDVYIPAGRYRTEIQPASNQKISGDGPQSVIIGWVRFLVCTNVVVEDLTIDGLSNWGSVFCLNGDMDNVLIQRLTILTEAGVGMNAVKMVGDHSAVGIRNVRITDCLIPSPGRMGIEFQNHGSFDPEKIRGITVSRNVITKAGAHDVNGMAISMSGNMNYCDISDNRIEDHGNAGIEMIGPSYSNCSRNTILRGKGNVVQFANATLMTGNTIAGNIVRGGPETGNFLLGSMRDSVISDNMIDFRAGGGSMTFTQEGEGKAGGNIVTGNTLLFSTMVGLMVDNVGRNIFMNNLIDGTGAPSTWACVRFYSPASTGNIFTKNVIRKNLSGGAHIDQPNGASGNVIADNIVDGLTWNGASENYGRVEFGETVVAPGATVTIDVPCNSQPAWFASAATATPLPEGIVLAARGKVGSIAATFQNSSSGSITIPAGTVFVASRVHIA